MADPFDLGDALIRDLPHVRVTRAAPRDGRPCVYVKRFKPEGLGNAAYWIRREYDFLLYFAFKKLRHTVEFATVTQAGDGLSTPLVESVATQDAGVTLADWLGVRPRYADGETHRHPFRHAGQFLQLLRACLVALQEIHQLGIVHCDIKEDNICLPYSPYPLAPGQAIRMEFQRLRLIDFAFSISRESPLSAPLPIGKADYQSKPLQAALARDRSCGQGETPSAQHLDCRADLYSLGYMAGQILQQGLLQPLGPAGHAAWDGARQLVERLKGFDDSEELTGDSLPHGGLIDFIDALLAPLEDLQAYCEFTVDSQKAPVYAPTPIATLTGEDESGLWQEHSEAPKPAADVQPDRSQAQPKSAKKRAKPIHSLVLAAELLGGLGGLFLAYNGMMRYGYLDWTGACRLLGEDRQIRECRLWPGSDTVLWTGSTHFPFRLPALPTLPGDNIAISADGLLTLGLTAKQYKPGDNLQVQAAAAIPLYLRVFNIDETGKVDAFYLGGKAADKPVTPGGIVKYPVHDPVYSIENQIDTAGSMKLVGIASEKPIPKDMALLDSEGKLTAQALNLSPTVVRLGYVVKAK